MTNRRDYKAEKAAMKDFLAMFYVEDNEGEGGKMFKYADQIRLLAEREQVAIHVSLNDMQKWATEHGHADLLANVQGNTLRYTQLMNDAVEELIMEHCEREGKEAPPVKDALDAFIYQRLEMAKEAQQRQRDDGQAGGTDDIRKMYPPQLMRRFEVYLNHPSTAPLAVREVRAEHIGKLVVMRGIVIRATEVKPLARVVTYTCDTCSNETYQPVSGDSFMPVVKCPSNDCLQSRANGRLMMQIRGSKFVKFQEIRIQEHSDQVPVGSIPRAITVHVEGELTRLAAPGDHVNVTGVFLPKVKQGFGGMRQGLLNDVFLQAHHIENLHRDSDGGTENVELTDAEMALISQRNLYSVLSSSIAPEIYGHEDIKKALLLQLVGGVDKAASGLKIRGAINICLMGDPGVAKSQLLGYVDRLAPRSQYTTGRGSSGVGLTAAVVKDPLTGEMTLEGGALVLADQGICCIDEFDKMVDQDRTAIHEVMEQQTISIAKAGIMTTLNARVSILAAANPAFGRYNPKRSLEQNIDLPAALLSRFDLLWLLLDKPDYDNDLRLAQHITYVHTHNKQPAIADKQPLDMPLMRRYIAMCKRRQPVVPEHLTGDLVEMYVNMRKEARCNANDSTFTSPRVLLAVIRIATALARLSLSDTVTKQDIEEAMRLTESSKESLRPDKQQRIRQLAPIDAIYGLAREMHDALPTDSEDRSIGLDQLARRAETHGFAEAQVQAMVAAYETSNVFMIDSGRLLFL